MGTIHGVGAVRVSIRLDVDPVVKISHIVVCDHMARAVEPDGRIRGESRWEFLTVHSTELCPEGANPAEEVIRIVPADEITIGDIEVARTGVVREDSKVDILKAAFLNGQSFRTRDELRACPNRDIRIPDGHALKVVVVGGFNIK